MDQLTFDGFVAQFEQARDADGAPLAVHHLAVSQADDVFVHRFGGRTQPSDVRSLSKTVMALIAGIHAMENPEFGFDMPVWPVLERVATLTNRDNAERWQQVTVKNLLNHTVGFDQVLLMRGDLTGLDPDRYVDHLVDAPLVHPPGEHYLYSNAGCYLLGVVLQEMLGEDLHAYANRRLFQPLGIATPEWERYGPYLAAATRLWLQPEDLLAVGGLLLREGTLRDGTELVAPAWLAQLREPTTFTPGVDTPTNSYFRRYAYAHGLWLGARNGIHFGHGTDGQTLAIVPEKDAVVVTLAHQRDGTRLEEIIDAMIAALAGDAARVAPS